MLIVMRRIVGWLVLLFMFGLPIWYVAHLIRNYVKIERELHHNEAYVVHPKVTDTDKAEIGYIYELRNETEIREGRLNLVWFVVVPATNVHYSGIYDSGYTGWKKGDSIQIIHNKDDDEADYGFLVGLHEPKQGKATFVWIINSDNEKEDYDPDDR
jgi:hypothetical protein